MQKFTQCKFLMVNIPVEKIVSLDEIESIDEAAEKLDRSLEGTGRILLEVSSGTNTS